MKELDADLLAIQEMRTAVSTAKKAQALYQGYSQEEVDKIVQAIAEAAFEASERLGEMAVEETGMGVAAHKKIKNEVGSKDVYESIKDLKTVGVIREDPAQKIIEIADPFGVILGIIPTTNPTSTAFFKVLIALKTRNAIVVSPHPYAVRCTNEALAVCHEAAVKAGAPEGLIQGLTQSSMEATQQAMTHKDIDLILATGGGALVRAAYSSGKPAYGVGPGNVPVYIERSAKIEQAIKHIVDSKSFDYGTICATEQAMVVDRNVEEMVKRELIKQKAYILSAEEKAKLEKVISPNLGRVNPKIVGKSPQFIAELAHIDIPSDTRILIAIETEVGAHIPFSLEKLSPIFALYRVNDVSEAKDMCLKLLELGGRGHSLSIHTESDEIAREFALEMPVSRILVNTMSSVGAVGGTTNLMPSMTLGCGSFGGNITSDNVSAHHLMNIKRLAYGIKEVDLSSVKNEVNASVEEKRKEVIVGRKPQISDVDEAVIKQLVTEIVNQLK